jgi:Seven in absentia protein family.
MVPPITMCTNGHSICPNCKPRLKRCPTCRGNLTDMRNRLTENISETSLYPCRYQDLGCACKLVLGTQEEHEMKCHYGPHKCPLYIVDSIKCELEGPATQLEQHIRSEHLGRHPVTVTSGKQSCYLPNYMNNIQGGYWHEIVFTFERMFFFYIKIIDDWLVMCYMFVGAREDINNYAYRVKVKTRDGEHSNSACMECPHYYKFIDSFRIVECFTTLKIFTESCVDEKDRLPFQYKIFRI